MTDTFPIPASGSLEIQPSNHGARVFEVVCKDLDKADYELLMGFFNQMGGRFRSFRFEFGGRVHESCCFFVDQVDFLTQGQGAVAVTFPIEIQRSN